MASPSVRVLQLASRRLLGGRTRRRHLSSAAAASDFPGRVRVVEVGPRDGLQNEKVVVPTEDKVSERGGIVLTFFFNVRVG